MNFANIFTEIEKVDPEFYERTSERRDIFKNFAKNGKRIALTALPLALGSVFQKAYGQTPPSVVDVLNFALTLEYLEAGFYNTGVGTAGLINSTDLPGFKIIQAHENEHVALLQGAITASGGTPVPQPTNVDYTGGGGTGTGPFAGVFSNYTIFLAVSQTFEDTGVRAYKGQAPNLLMNAVLTTALQIHSVEARHASYVRQVRGVRPWITEATSDIPSPYDAAVAANYAGEDNAAQAGINIVGIGGNAGITMDEATQAFDEPLSMAQVLAILQPAFLY